MDDRISELEARVEELEKVIEGFQRVLKRRVEEKMWTETSGLLLHRMGEVVMSYDPPTSRTE